MFLRLLPSLFPDGDLAKNPLESGIHFGILYVRQFHRCKVVGVQQTVDEPFADTTVFNLASLILHGCPFGPILVTKTFPEPAKEAFAGTEKKARPVWPRLGERNEMSSFS
jgi:hypothetical protein